MVRTLLPGSGSVALVALSPDTFLLLTDYKKVSPPVALHRGYGRLPSLRRDPGRLSSQPGG